MDTVEDLQPGLDRCEASAVAPYSLSRRDEPSEEPAQEDFRRRSKAPSKARVLQQMRERSSEDEVAGEDWKLDGEESGDDEVHQVRPSAVVVETPRSGTSTVASYDQEHQSAEVAPLVIPADAPLSDGLRALMVHHLKRAVGSDTISLTGGQAELLEHHLARLASYAQKIVHTLAFATRFLTSDATPEPSGEQAEADREGNSRSASRENYEEPPEPPAPRPPAVLKLKDRDILDIYRSAQLEASKEADWRGIVGAPSEGGSSSRSVPSGVDNAMATAFATQGTANQGDDVLFLREVSRVMQQPGRTPEAFAAEIIEPAGNVLGWCQSQKALAQREAMKSAGIGWPQVPPDPGARQKRKIQNESRTIV